MSSGVKPRLGRSLNLVLIPFAIDVSVILFLYFVANVFLVNVLDWHEPVGTVFIQILTQAPENLGLQELLARVIVVLMPVWLIVSLVSSAAVYTLLLLRADRETPNDQQSATT